MPAVRLRLFGRLRELMEGVALPLALQGLYVIAVRFAGDIGTGNVTSFSYAYLIASALVALDVVAALARLERAADPPRRRRRPRGRPRRSRRRGSR